eukprot:9570052-Lingulodinium_polyedra.AAC.1
MAGGTPPRLQPKPTNGCPKTGSGACGGQKGHHSGELPPQNGPIKVAPKLPHLELQEIRCPCQ